MKRPLLLALVAAVGLAACAQQMYFKDQEGELTVTNIGSFKSERDRKDPNIIRLTSKATSGKATIDWKAENLKAQFTTLDMVANQSERGREIREAKMGGGAEITVIRPTDAKASKATQTIVLAAQNIDFNGETGRADARGGVRIDQNDPAAETKMNARGASGYAVINPLKDKSAKGSLEEAALVGSARIDLTSVRFVTQKGVRKKVTYNVIVTGDKMVFQLNKSGDDYGTVTMTGNVVATGDDPVLFAKMEGYSRVVIVLDESKKPVSIEGDRGPGTITATDKGGGVRR